MGKLLFLGVTAFLAIRYISKSSQKDKPQISAGSPPVIDQPQATPLPPAGS